MDKILEEGNQLNVAILLENLNSRKIGIPLFVNRYSPPFAGDSKMCRNSMWREYERLIGVTKWTESYPS